MMNTKDPNVQTIVLTIKKNDGTIIRRGFVGAALMNSDEWDEQRGRSLGQLLHNDGNRPSIMIGDPKPISQVLSDKDDEFVQVVRSQINDIIDDDMSN